jgi:hypothetical protein
MPQTMIMSSSNQSSARLDREDPIVVTTPLEAIMRLEQWQIQTVVLAGSYATNHELAAFLDECYPAVLVERER